MKKLVLSIAAVLAVGTVAHAQQEVKFGPKAGVNFANVSGIDDTDMKTSFYVGAVAEIKFNDKFSVQPELLYSSQGYKVSGSETIMGVTATFEGTQKLDYINVPIMAKYYIIDGFSVEAGPQIGFLIKAEGEGESTAMGTTSKIKEDNKDFYKSIDFGVNFGLAYDLPMGLFINARYNLGLADIRDNSDNGDAIKNNVIQVGVGYKF